MNIFNYKDFSWAVDFRKITFLFATTEAQDIFHALMDRCERIDLQEYTHEELAEIVKMAAEDIKFSNDNLVKEIASTLRGSGTNDVYLQPSGNYPNKSKYVRVSSVSVSYTHLTLPTTPYV